MWDGSRGGDVGRKISKNTALMGKESYAEGLGWDSASADGEDTTEIFRRQISRTECGERGVWEKAQVSGMRTGWMLEL